MPLFPPKRIIRATTQQEVDAAFSAADQVIVEGDDHLLYYAIGRSASSSGRRKRRWLKVFLYIIGISTFFGTVLIGLITLRYWSAAYIDYLEERGRFLSLSPEPDITPLLILKELAWPAVAVVAIIALFLIARQAISGDRNVEIGWKVTEKVTGRVIITKVRTSVTKARKSA